MLTALRPRQYPRTYRQSHWRRHLIGEDVDIASSAQLYGPIYLGSGVKIKDVTIYGPSVIRDYP